jgi:hypothetical protein
VTFLRFYPLLAHHWSRAEAGERASFYLEHAGDQALRRHANQEALRFFTEVIEIDEKLALPFHRMRPLSWGAAAPWSARGRSPHSLGTLPRRRVNEPVPLGRRTAPFFEACSG